MPGITNQAKGSGIDVAGLLRGGTAAGRWVLDPAASRVEFHVRHFWGAVTVHGRFANMSGVAQVGPGDPVSGQLTIDAGSLDTNNAKRDAHLRSAGFFDVEHHPAVTVTISDAAPSGPSALTCHATLTAAGHTEPVEFTAHVTGIADGAVAVTAELVVDRTRFGMTWSPLRIAAKQARATVMARFTRQ